MHTAGSGCLSWWGFSRPRGKGGAEGMMRPLRLEREFNLPTSKFQMKLFESFEKLVPYPRKTCFKVVLGDRSGHTIEYTM